MMEDRSFHVMDLAENAAAAEATRIAISVREDSARDLLVLQVTDNGRGMSEETVAQALDPFFTTGAKRTGLGLPLLAQAARQTGGDIKIDSKPGRGTRITARFRHSHIDRQPLTKMAETLMILIFGHPGIEFRYRHRRDGRAFAFSSSRFLPRDAGGTPADPETIRAIQQALRNGLDEIGAASHTKREVSGR